MLYEQLFLRVQRVFFLCSMMIILFIFAWKTENFMSKTGYVEDSVSYNEVLDGMEKSEIKKGRKFDGKILEIEADVVLVKKLEDDNEILVYCDSIEESLVLGDEVQIELEYGAILQETIPPRINALYIERKRY